MVLFLLFQGEASVQIHTRAHLHSPEAVLIGPMAPAIIAGFCPICAGFEPDIPEGGIDPSDIPVSVRVPGPVRDSKTY